MSYKWPANTVFHELTLEVEDRTCPKCQQPRVAETKRDRRFFTFEGPVHLTCQLCRCSNPTCSEYKTLVSPEAEMRLAMPYWVLGWDVLCWLGLYSDSYLSPQRQLSFPSERLNRGAGGTPATVIFPQ